MRSFRLFRIAGIDVGVHPSWLVVFGLVTWSLATGYYPVVLGDADNTTYWLLGAVSAILLFAAVLVHELAHSLVARAQGLDARSITLFIFGGVSNLGGESPRPGVEFLVSIVGPLSSFAIAGLALLGASAAPSGSAAEAVLSYLAVVNGVLGLFNLIPGFPLDGGRVLRSIVWRATGSLRRATEVAAAAGTVVAYGFLIWGFLQVLDGEFLSGIWIAAIGWFLQTASAASVQQVRLEEALRGTRVAEIVRRDPATVAPSMSVGDLIEDYFLPQNRRAMPVSEDGRLRGIVTLGDIAAVPSDRRATTPVGSVMGGQGDALVTVAPSASLAAALEALGRGDYEQVPVVEDGRLVGMLTRADVLRQFQLRETLGLGAEDGTATGPNRRGPGPVDDGALRAEEPAAAQRR
jgi:Zn-dependent protease/CBS domain-containing protein